MNSQLHNSKLHNKQLHNSHSQKNQPASDAGSALSLHGQPVHGQSVEKLAVPKEKALAVSLQEIVTLLHAEVVLPKQQTTTKTKQQASTVNHASGSGEHERIQALLQETIAGIATLDTADDSSISFLANKKYAKDLKSTQAKAVIIQQNMLADCPVAALVVPDAYVGFAKVSQLFAYKTQTIGVAATAIVHETASVAADVTIADHVVIGAYCRIAAGVSIAANTVIEDHVCIGEHSRIAANVTIGHHTQIGSHVHIHSQASIGSDGFGYAPHQTDAGFAWEKIAQLGKVVIGDKVRIGANTCIDRGALGDTIIGNGVIIDNLVQIAHNVQIGDHTAIAACTGISGSTKIGKHCVLAGGVGVAGHIQIVDNVTITGRTVVTGSINQAGSYSSGTSMMPTNTWRRAAVNFKKLAQSPFKYITTEINDLKSRLNQVESRIYDKPNQ